MPGLLLPLLSLLTASKYYCESISKAPPIPESIPFLAIVSGEGPEKPLPPMLPSLLSFAVSLLGSFVLSLLALSMTENLMPQIVIR